VVHDEALTNMGRILRMRLEPGNLGHAVVDPDGPLPAPARALDDLHLQDVVLVKLDLEGHEALALDGAWRTLVAWHPLVLVEDWQQVLGTGLLRHLGYRLARAWPDQQTYLYEWGG
jgi:hypothetical protein